mmetsp:Transcript_56287/g.164511  ORF Transcript_56287/g.164511 Transcript_56287/m.164511 type:complete len:420 (-) Transcript_56287:1745-3004(-)
MLPPGAIKLAADGLPQPPLRLAQPEAQGVGLLLLQELLLARAAGGRGQLLDLPPQLAHACGVVHASLHLPQPLLAARPQLRLPLPQPLHGLPQLQRLLALCQHLHARAVLLAVSQLVDLPPQKAQLLAHVAYLLGVAARGTLPRAPLLWHLRACAALRARQVIDLARQELHALPRLPQRLLGLLVLEAQALELAGQRGEVRGLGEALLHLGQALAEADALLRVGALEGQAGGVHACEGRLAGRGAGGELLQGISCLPKPRLQLAMPQAERLELQPQFLIASCCSCGPLGAGEPGLPVGPRLALLRPRPAHAGLQLLCLLLQHEHLGTDGAHLTFQRSQPGNAGLALFLSLQDTGHLIRVLLDKQLHVPCQLLRLLLQHKHLGADGAHHTFQCSQPGTASLALLLSLQENGHLVCVLLAK